MSSYLIWTPEQRRRARHGITIELPSIESELHALGLHATANLVNMAVQRLGWDIAEHEKREEIRRKQQPADLGARGGGE